MASISKRPDGRWRARYRDPDGKEHAKHFQRKVDGERWLVEQQSKIARGEYVDPNAGRQTLGSYAEQWVAAQVHRPSTAAVIEVDLRRHILPTFGHRQLASVHPSEVQAWVRGRSEVLAPATVERAYRCLASIFKSAVRDRLIARSPCQDIRLPKVSPKQVVPLSTEQLARLLSEIPDRYRAPVVLAAGTGLRQGEAFGVTLDEIDWLRRSLSVRHQLSQVGSAPPTLAPPKTAASHRTVPLPDVVLDALAEHVREYPPGPDGLLFTGPNGAPLRRNRFGDSVWRPARERAGLPHVNFHDLRHTYASLLIRHGESVKVVQARLGHASASETLDTYSHLWPDSEDRTRLAVDTALGRLTQRHADKVRTADGVEP